MHHNVGHCGRHAPCDQRHKPCRLYFFRLRSSGRYDCTQTPSKRLLCTSYHVYQAPRLTEPLPHTPAASTLRKRKTNKTEYSGGRMRCFLPTALMDPENKCTQKNTHLTISPAQLKKRQTSYLCNRSAFSAAVLWRIAAARMCDTVLSFSILQKNDNDCRRRDLHNIKMNAH